MPHEMEAWRRWDEDEHKWIKDPEITVASQYMEEEAKETPRSRRGGRGRGRARSGKGSGRSKADRRRPRTDAAQPPPGRAQPQPSPSFGAKPAPPPPKHPMFASLQGTVQSKPKALKLLGLGPAQRISSEELRKAYRQQALKWHPDRPQNHGREEEANKKFLEIRESFEFMQACMEPLKLHNLSG